MRSAFSYVSGSFSLSQRALLGIHSAETLAKPLYFERRVFGLLDPDRLVTARTSIHMIAGRRTLSCRSRATTVQVVASTERPAISSERRSPRRAPGGSP